jgi:triosephosphate isomerase
MIAGNWKMNATVDEAVSLVGAMVSGLDGIKGVDRLICPPFVSLSAVKVLLNNSSVKLGAQNMYFEEKGAYTGEISPLMLTGLCSHVILGHSERRQYFGETPEMIDKKVKVAFKYKLTPILCIGEKLEENEAGKTEEVLAAQYRASADNNYYDNGLIIAYEPIWAIGTGRSATGEQANQTIGFIRSLITQDHGQDVADKVRILYGGSVTAANIAELMEQPEIDGALVGGASLKAMDFVNIAEQTAKIRGIA